MIVWDATENTVRQGSCDGCLAIGEGISVGSLRLSGLVIPPLAGFLAKEGTIGKFEFVSVACFLSVCVLPGLVVI